MLPKLQHFAVAFSFNTAYTQASCCATTAKHRIQACPKNTSTTTTGSSVLAAVDVPQYVLKQIFYLTGDIQADIVCSVIGTLYAASSASSSATSCSVTWLQG
jgi:hypothetical protein